MGHDCLATSEPALVEKAPTEPVAIRAMVETVALPAAAAETL